MLLPGLVAKGELGGGGPLRVMSLVGALVPPVGLGQTGGVEGATRTTVAGIRRVWADGSMPCLLKCHRSPGTSCGHVTC
jgi:hypothetical protein